MKGVFVARWRPPEALSQFEPVAAEDAGLGFVARGGGKEALQIGLGFAPRA